MKRCPKCKSIKETSEFYVRPAMKDGFSCWCKKCNIESSKRWESTPAGKVATKAKYKRWKQNNPDSVKACNRKHNLLRYGITPDDYQNIFSTQGACCAICKTDKPANGQGNFHVDHDHQTGRVRGILCSECNIGLGKFNDDPRLLTAAAAYLQLQATVNP